MSLHRRGFLKITGAGILASGMPAIGMADSASITPELKKTTFRLGIASYSLRKFSVEEALVMTKRLGISAITFKDMHLPLDWTEERIKPVINIFTDAGIDVYGGGVINMKTREEADQAFEYARMAGMKVIIGSPNHELLPYVEEKVKTYDIKLAIHNHGPTDKLYPGPAEAYELINNLDPRVGLCVDMGHTARLGLDPSEEIEKYFHRVLDIHIKDVTQAKSEGDTCVMGQGVIDIPKMMKTLIRLNYMHTLAQEYEAEENDPLPGMARSFGYLEGVIATLGYKVE